MRVSYYSLGCKVNLYESQAVINTFLDNGFSLVPFHDESDVYIINTCSITAMSDAKSRKMIRQAHRRNPEAIVAVMGCYAQLHSDAIEKIEGVDIIIGTHHRDRLYQLTINQLKQKEQKRLIDNIAKVKNYEEIKINRYLDKTRGFVKIEDGCDNFCTYCTIPYARGRVRSRNRIDILDEIKRLTAQGMKEIVLTGINTALYGKDLANYDFADLLADIFTSLPNDVQIRISSIEVTEINDKLLNCLSRFQDKMCQHLHIPLQSGSDAILKLMNRRYTTLDYAQKLTQIRTFFPEINITTDVMVGFCGETDVLFQETYDFISKMQFGELHVFPYSKRPLTKAFHYTNHVAESIKHERVAQLLKLNDSLAKQYRLHFIDQIHQVLVEKIDKGYAYGHTSHYMQVKVLAKTNVNERINVRLVDANYPITKGEIQ